MSEEKVILLKQYQKSKQNPKMFFLVILAGVLMSLVIWRVFVENVERLDVQIPESQNILFNDTAPLSMTTAQIADELEKGEGKPTLIYLYTTWCRICTKNFENINETAREFQNTDLQIIALAIDRDLAGEKLGQYLNQFGDVYFQPRFLAFKDGFREFLRKKDIRYGGKIPFTILISGDGEVVTKFTGRKRKNFLRNKIIQELYI